MEVRLTAGEVYLGRGDAEGDFRRALEQVTANSGPTQAMLSTLGAKMSQSDE
jgi:hypothetical protein